MTLDDKKWVMFSKALLTEMQWWRTLQDGTLTGTLPHYVSILCFPCVCQWHNQMLNHNQMVWGKTGGRGTERVCWCTSFSVPVVVSSSFSSSVCMELSSCCRIISWNWAIPFSAPPLLRPGQARWWKICGRKFYAVSTYLNPSMFWMHFCFFYLTQIICLSQFYQFILLLLLLKTCWFSSTALLWEGL